jgi:anti-sigma regulatory factor (Ser/Thr protein kinase)
MTGALRLPIVGMADAAVARSVVRRFAIDIGLSRRAANEAAIAASELVTNVVKYAGTGELLISDEPRGLQITALDRGPGLSNSEELFADGVSQGSRLEPDQPISGGRGTGGGALLRLCDHVELGHRPGGGAMIRVCKLR